MTDVNGVELFVLGRKLMKLAEEVLPGGKLGLSVRSVLLDVGAHPWSSISEITERTGFPQSHVSASVARLRAVGAVATEPDPLDRRRTLVRVVPAFVRRAARPASTSIDDAIAGALGGPADATGTSEGLAEILDALELLGRRLTPKVHDYVHEGVAS